MNEFTEIDSSTELASLKAQHAALNNEIGAIAAKIAAATALERADAVGAVKADISEFGIKPTEVFSASELSAVAASKPTKADIKPAPVKYRNAAGDTWAGRGKRPHWLRYGLASGATLESFKV